MKRIISSLLGLALLASCVETGNNADELLKQIRQTGEEVRNQIIPDKRVGVFDVDYRIADNGVIVKGVTTSAEAKTLLLDTLSRKGYEVLDSLQLLPDAEKLQGNTYGIVNLSVCNLHVKDDFSSEMTTQGLLGMPVRVLDHASWYRIQTPDNYIAWVHRAGVALMNEEEYNHWNRAEKIIVTSHYGFTYKKPDANAQVVSDVVSGDRLKWDGVTGDYYNVSYPDGRRAYISRTISQPERVWRNALKQDAESIIRTAKTLLGVPYLWAGTSAKGMDCSGFVRTVLYQHDIIVPRDASQQAYVGEHIDIAPDFENVVPGDLIFFGSKATPERKERVVHVAIYIGDKKFIHAQGDVRINSFDPENANYDEFNFNRLLFATRFLHLVNRLPEINTTVTNPYYQPVPNL